MALKRNTVVIGAVAFAVAFAVAASRGLFGYPPNTSGTIGAAKRYQSGQVTNGDVQLTDSQLQSFMQSDLFHKMQVNPEFRKAVEAGLAKAVAKGDLGVLAKEGDALGRVSSDPGFVALSGKPEFGKLLIDDRFQHLAGDLATDPTLTGPELGREAEMAAAAHEVSTAATALARAAETARMPEISNPAEQLAKSADEATAAANAACQGPVPPEKHAELNNRIVTLARDADALSRSDAVAKDPDVSEKALALSRSVDRLTRVSDDPSDAVMTGRVTDLVVRSNALAKAAETAKLVDAGKAKELAKDAAALAKAVSLGRSEATTSKAAALAKDAAVLAKEITLSKAELAKAELSKDVQASKSEMSKADLSKAVTASKSEMSKADLAKAVTASKSELSKEEMSKAVTASKSEFSKADLAKADAVARASALGKSADALGRASEISRMIAASKAEASRTGDLMSMIDKGTLSKDEAFAKALAKSDLARSPEFTGLMKSPEFMKLLLSKDFQALARAPEFGRAMNSREVLSLVRKPEFGKLMFNVDVQKFLASSETVALARTPDFAREFLQPTN